MAARGCASLKASPQRARGEGSGRAGRSPCWIPGHGMGMSLGTARGLGVGSSDGGSVPRESPSVSQGHPTGAVPAQCRAPRLSAAGDGDVLPWAVLCAMPVAWSASLGSSPCPGDSGHTCWEPAAPGAWQNQGLCCQGPLHLCVGSNSNKDWGFFPKQPPGSASPPGWWL